MFSSRHNLCNCKRKELLLIEFIKDKKEEEILNPKIQSCGELHLYQSNPKFSFLYHLCLQISPFISNQKNSYPNSFFFFLNIEMMKSCKFSTFFFTLCFSYAFACTFTVTNNCPYTIWPGTLAGAGTPALATTGFQLDSGQSVRIPSIPGWSGRIWARTGCNFDASGVGSCQTGDCGGRLECDGSGASPPASLFEITLGT